MKWSIGGFRTFVGGERAIDVEYKLFIKNTCPFERTVHDTHSVCVIHTDQLNKKKKEEKDYATYNSSFEWIFAYIIYICFSLHFSQVQKVKVISVQVIYLYS